jgi:hypothetical protein
MWWWVKNVGGWFVMRLYRLVRVTTIGYEDGTKAVFNLPWEVAKVESFQIPKGRT